jgi:hypothetical protein
MTRVRTAVSILVVSLCAGLSAHAQAGRITFTGSIVERTCPLRDGLPDCPPGRVARAVVHVSALDPTALPFDASLLDYAVRRGGAEASRGWRLIEVAWR